MAKKDETKKTTAEETKNEAVENTGDSVDISKDDLKELIVSNRELRQSNADLKGRIDKIESGEPQVLEAVRKNTARVRVMDGKYVLGWTKKGTYEERDPHTHEMVAYRDLILEGVDKPKKVNNIEFLNNTEAVNAEIVDVKTEPIEVNQGFTDQKQFDGHVMKETGSVVPLKVKGEHSVYTLKTPDGHELELDEQYINV